jgi:hypothetical protein
VCGKEEGFFCWVCHVFTITATGSPGRVWRTIDLYFFFDLWMNYGWTTTLLLITLHLNATGLAKGGGWMDFWDGGKGMIGREALGRFEATTRRLDIHTNIK